MRLRQIKVSGWQCFANEVTVGPFADGINVVHAPNGTGKSTIFTALRRALLDGHRAGDAALGCERSEPIQRLRPQSARRPIDNPVKRGIIARIDDQTRVGHDVADLAALKEGVAADDLIGNVPRAKSLFERGEEPARSDENREVAVAADAAIHRIADVIGDAVRFRDVIAKAANSRIISSWWPRMKSRKDMVCATR